MTDQDRWENMSEEERDGAKHGLFGTYWSEIERQARADNDRAFGYSKPGGYDKCHAKNVTNVIWFAY